MTTALIIVGVALIAVTIAVAALSLLVAASVADDEPTAPVTRERECRHLQPARGFDACSHATYCHDHKWAAK